MSIVLWLVAVALAGLVWWLRGRPPAPPDLPSLGERERTFTLLPRGAIQRKRPEP